MFVKDAAFRTPEQAKHRQTCHFPAKELRSYRNSLAAEADKIQRDGGDCTAKLKEINLIDQARLAHQANTGCACWFGD